MLSVRTRPGTLGDLGFLRAMLYEAAYWRASIRGRRRQGSGTALMRALVARAARNGVPALSLSVERDNPALRLNEALGFRPVAVADNSVTMVLDLWEVR